MESNRPNYCACDSSSWKVKTGRQPSLVQYVTEKRVVDPARSHSATADDAAGTHMSTERRHEYFTEQAMKGKIAIARGLLEGKRKAPRTQETAEHVADLVAVCVPDTEERDFEVALALAKNEARKACEPKCSAVRRRIFMANVNAEPGPSGMRNGFAQALSRVESGVHALQKWLSVWAKDKMSPYAQRLWGRVVVIPIQDGARPRVPDAGNDESAPIPTVGVTPKLRPIGLAECLLKIGEGAKLDPLMAEIRRCLEPYQLGVCTPDGVVLLILLLRAWTDAIETFEDDHMLEDPSAIVPLDLRNAYGLFFRSHALKAAVEFNSDVATLAAAEWAQKPEYWINVQGKWQCHQTHRGFWQGRRLSMLMFCLSLAKSLADPSLGLRGAGLAYVSIQDDTYLVGSLKTFGDKRPDLVVSSWARWASAPTSQMSS